MLTICTKKPIAYKQFVLKTIIQAILWFFVVINQIKKHKAKIYNQCTYTLIIIKNNLIFSSQRIRISRNSINFDNKKIKKKDYYNKNKKIFKIKDIDFNKINIL